MKAVVCSRKYGLLFTEVPRPSIGPHEVLVRTINTGVCGSDVSFLKNNMFQEGSILGHEISAEVHAVGSLVGNIALGQRVILRPSSCGLCHYCTKGLPHFCSVNRRVLGVRDLPGGFAEYIRVFP